MADIELVIKIDEGIYKSSKQECAENDSLIIDNFTLTIGNGIPLAEIPNPCIECSQNCCVCELNGEKCECQKVYVLKEKNNGT